MGRWVSFFLVDFLLFCFVWVDFLICLFGFADWVFFFFLSFRFVRMDGNVLSIIRSGVGVARGGVGLTTFFYASARDIFFLTV